jgi:hypothetical protein
VRPALVQEPQNLPIAGTAVRDRRDKSAPGIFALPLGKHLLHFWHATCIKFITSY